MQYIKLLLLTAGVLFSSVMFSTEDLGAEQQCVACPDDGSSWFSKPQGGMLMVATIQKYNFLPAVTVLAEDEEILLDRQSRKPKSFNDPIRKMNAGKGYKDDGGKKTNLRGKAAESKKMRGKTKKLFRKGILFVLISKL